MKSKLCLAALTVAAAVLVLPTGASAAVSCTYTGAPFNLLQVDVGASGDSVALDTGTASDAEIQVFGSNSPTTCSGDTPTRNNTSEILIKNHAGHADDLVVIADAPRFAAISTTVDLSAASTGATLEVLTEGSTGGSIQFGTRASDSATLINTNACCDASADITAIGVERLIGIGQDAGPDRFGAQGGLGTGDPLATPITIVGHLGENFLFGGEGPDAITGGPDADQMQGNGGDDLLGGSAGDDSYRGGPGTDSVDFRMSTDPVSIDLAKTGPQSIGIGSDTFRGIENLTGTDARSGDVLLGNGRPNTLVGSDGRDTLVGRAGVDNIVAGRGDDVINARDGGPDTVDCGLGKDTVKVDPHGLDKLVDCEVRN